MGRARGWWLIAHRGASAVAPENTGAAVRAAIAAGADMVELDIQLTADGRLVVVHYDELRRITGVRGRLAARSYAQVARFDAGRWFDGRFAGERIPLVSQVLRMTPLRVRLNLELKRTRRRKHLIAAVQRLLQRPGVRGRLLLSSFDPALMARLGRSRVPRALISRRAGDTALRQAVQLGCAAWHPHVRLVTRRRVASAHAAGLRVHAWTVDDPTVARRLLGWGVDGLFTNDPARLKGLR